MAEEGEEVTNRRVILKRYVTGCPTEDDMEVVAGTVRLAVPPGSAAVLVKNLYLSCDPYMRTRMTRHDEDEPSFVPDYVPGQVLNNCSVCKVVISGHPDFKPGDLLWGVTGWEEYTLISNPQFLVSDYAGEYGRFEEEMAGHLREGRVVCVEDVAEGIEAAPAALVGLFAGRNVGKQVVALARE